MTADQLIAHLYAKRVVDSSADTHFMRGRVDKADSKPKMVKLDHPWPFKTFKGVPCVTPAIPKPTKPKFEDAPF